MEPPKNILPLKNKVITYYSTYSANLNHKSYFDSFFPFQANMTIALWTGALTTLLFQSIFGISLLFSLLYQRRQKPCRPTRSTKKQIPVTLRAREFLLKRKYHFRSCWVDSQNTCETSCIELVIYNVAALKNRRLKQGVFFRLSARITIHLDSLTHLV